jgi:putative transposase
MVAKPRVIHRDGIHFQGLRYLDPTIAAYVREPVTIRYDPRDLGEIRVFHHNQFLCRAISPEHAGQQITLKDIQAARTVHRRALRDQLDKRRATVAEYLPRHPSDPEIPAVSPQSATTARPAKSTPRLRAYLEDLTDTHTDDDRDDDERTEP